ncbi:DUF6037 family protein [Lysinibacillus xylanilyticus]|uniref:DUF6037 family protein n=1 Tax=Lysinibacillus xylanilyticus TaxID=582475 RepID=UPI002B255053|nr:DUF6037 family protein [Lysinibacillus xylanilyticus]MEB2282592.1 DUF6037 family protein [Lysinibacillus xylanilyticus]
MTKVFRNLTLLKEDMEKKGWFIDSFLFNYKREDFVVLVKLYDQNEIKPDFSLLKIEFFRNGNLNDNLRVAANSTGLIVDVKTLREYFKIEYSENLGDILKQFYQYFSEFIPFKVGEFKTDAQKEIMVTSLSESDSEDPNKKYCYAVRTNPNRKDGSPGQRSPYNDNKTRIRRSELYNELGKYKHLSFCYSENNYEEKSDEEIIKNWAKNKK